MAGGKKLTKEEELLLQDFSRNVSTKSSALFYGNALVVSAIPIWFFWRIHMMDLYQSGIIFALVTCLSTYLVAMAYKKTHFVLKHKLAQKVGDGVAADVNEWAAENASKMTRKEKDERILWKKNEVADYQATTYSIFYNNAVFLTICLLASFLVLRSASPSVNYIASMGAASGLVALFSTGTQ